MNLLLDIGNSRIKWGLADAKGQLSRSGAFNPPKEQPEINLPRLLLQLEWPTRELDKIVVCSTGEHAQFARLSGWLKVNSPARIVTFTSHTLPADAQYAVEHSYKDASQLGDDRWAALLAARQLQKQGKLSGEVVIADCGTAVTIDVLSADGRHLGGYILPGVVMMRSVLHYGTADLPMVDSGFECRPGDNTQSAINSGSVIGLVAAIERVVEGHDNPDSTSSNSPRSCLLSGGDAEALSGFLAIPHQIDAELVLKGLALTLNYS